MDSDLILYSLSRIIHVGTAIVLVGGTFFVRCVLIPTATASLADDVHTRLREAIMVKWKMIVHAGVGLFILSGGVNYGRVIIEHTHKGDPLYHALLGTKIILALVVFFIAEALVGRSAAFAGMRRNAPRWLAINLVLAAIIVAISGFLKVRGVPPAKVQPATTGQISHLPAQVAGTLRVPSLACSQPNQIQYPVLIDVSKSAHNCNSQVCSKTTAHGVCLRL